MCLAGYDHHVSTPGSDFPNALSRHFAHQLNELIRTAVSVSDDEDVRDLTPGGLHDILVRSYPEVAVSRSHVYRLTRGDTLPSYTLTCALAKLFRVSPQYFMPAGPDDYPLSN